MKSRMIVNDCCVGRLSIAACLALVPCLMVAIGGEGATNAVASVPPLLRPAALTDADGAPETDLVDPFRRRGEDMVVDGLGSTDGEDGLLRTSFGEISSEFRILAITIPADTNTPRTALIQFYASDEPVLVHEGDLVRVDRVGANSTRGARNARNRRANAARVSAARGRRNAPRSGGLADIDIEEQLKKYVFYLSVKNIEPTFIEVYHNKKRPDETIRLNW